MFLDLEQQVYEYDEATQDWSRMRAQVKAAFRRA
jgi:hypothetical protein